MILTEAAGADLAVALIGPKYAHNVGAAVRAASCYGIPQVWFTGTRVQFATGAGKRFRLPREERMRGYRDVDICHTARLFDRFPRHVTPVAVELVPGAEPLHTFVHPANALYVFGPEDGSLGRVDLGQCHRFVRIPAAHCLNLAVAVATVLYDRHVKQIADGLVDPLSVSDEERGQPWQEPESMHETVGVR